MASHGIRDRAAVVGMGCTRFTDHWARGLDDLIVEAADAALADAGIDIAEVDAFWLGTAKSGASGMLLSNALKLEGKPVTRVENYCATGSEAFRNAAYSVAAGAYDIVLAVGAEKLKDSGYAGLLPMTPPNDGTGSTLSAPALFSFLADAYAEKYGLSREDMKTVLVRIAQKNHANGAKNTKAQFQKAVPESTIRNAPTVAGMLGVFDCSGMSDGACAAVITSADAAKRFPAPLWVKGMALVAGSGTGPTDPTFDFVTLPEVTSSAAEAYRQAGITDPRAQLGLAEVHDCFTPTELVLIEDLGLSARGKGWHEVLEGVFDLDGELPINPDGGLKSFGHPVGASGLRMLYECWLQLRGNAGERQIANIGAGTSRPYGLTQNLGGPPGECLSFVGVVGAERG